MIEHFKNNLDLIPKTIPIIYIIGFLVVNANLSIYGFTDYDILNATYLKAGVVTIILSVFIFISVYFSYSKETMTDNLTKSWPSTLLSIYNTGLLSLILIFFLFDFRPIIKNRPDILFAIMILLFLHFTTRILLDKKIAKNKAGIFVLTLGPLLTLSPILILLVNFIDNAGNFVFFILASGLVIGISLGIYGDNEYRGRIFSDIMFLLIGSIYFGRVIYGHIPSKFGGGAPVKIVCNVPFNHTKNSLLNRDTLSVLYENNERMLLQNKEGLVIYTLKSETGNYLVLQPE